MGQEIVSGEFDAAAFARFGHSLAQETAALRRLYADGRLDASTRVTGFECESWLLDHATLPHPINQRFLSHLGSALVVPELSRFNVELNGTPQRLGGRALRSLESELQRTWARCLKAAHELEGTLLLIGILPTIREQDLSLGNISPLNRYYALNAQVLQARGGRALRIDIDGRERLQLEHDDVMLEAATTSFQVHLQAPIAQVTRYYNASVLLSAPLVAACANSPYLFGRDLWDETRIPLFEQAVDTGDEGPYARKRVSFGERYLEHPLEPFEENLADYPALLPLAFDDAATLPHLRLHNGTIWRWNRMLLGFDEARHAHLRIEQRVLPAGPSIIDMIANAAVYLGAVHFLACMHGAPEADLPFAAARANFYRAARQGLDAELHWLGGAPVSVRTLMLDEILPMAAEGLRQLGIDPVDRSRYLDLVAARVRSGQTGSAWQRAWVARHGADFRALVAQYLEHQRSAMPVHEWDV